MLTYQATILLMNSIDNYKQNAFTTEIYIYNMKIIGCFFYLFVYHLIRHKKRVQQLNLIM
jgi:hypothetical protein